MNCQQSEWAIIKGWNFLQYSHKVPNICYKNHTMGKKITSVGIGCRRPASEKFSLNDWYCKIP